MNNNETGNLEQQQEFQIIAEDHSSSPQDIYFDNVVGALQDIVFDEQFEGMQRPFMNKYCQIFEDSEENKFQYTEVFTLYQKQIQKYVEKSISSRVPDFDMQKFQSLLEGRHDQIDEMILDTLESFTQFSAFKKLMLQHKSYLQNEQNFKGLSVKSNKLA